MKLNKYLKVLPIALLTGLAIVFPVSALAHIADSESSPSQEAKLKKGKVQQVAIGFKALNGSERVTCSGPIDDLGNTARDANLVDLRFYVSGVQLLRKGGGAVTVQLRKGSRWSYSRGASRVTLIDLENGTGACAEEGTIGTNGWVRGSVPKGNYVGVRYSLSVPQALNHTDLTGTPAPLNLTSMAWSWQAGRKFMKVELSESEDGGSNWGTYLLHVGSTGCTGDPAAGEVTDCALPNRNRITLSSFNSTKQLIALDLRRLFAGVDIGDVSGMMPGCMSGAMSAACGPLFQALGMEHTTTNTTMQTAFRVIRR
jgi:uncharacterized repeat protein (TIGR04052 family)